MYGNETARKRIIHLLKFGNIADKEERQNLELLVNSKRWNPYCLRHSSISHDSDYLPEYALKKKVRWSMNSKQGTRYIKKRMGKDLKEKILLQNGILSDMEANKKAALLSCGRCGLTNAIDNKYCSKCSYPLVQSALDEIKQAENSRFQALELKYEDQLKAIREEMETRFSKLVQNVDLSKLT